MNKKLLLCSLPFLLALTSCGDNPASGSGSSSDMSQLENSLSSLSNGYSLEYVATEAFKVTGGSGSETTYRSIRNAMASENVYRHIAYEEIVSGTPKKDVIREDSTYQNKNGSLVISSLDYRNKIVTEPVVSNYQGVSWKASHFGNLFASLTKDDFSKNGDTYSLKKESIKTSTSANFASQLSGEATSAEKLSSFSLTFGGDGTISFKASFEPYTVTYLTEIQVTDSFEGTIVSSGEVVAVPTPIDKIEDTAFVAAFAKLKTSNFSSTVTNSEILFKDGMYEEVATASLTSAENGIAYSFYDENERLKEDTIYYSLNDNEVQKVAKYGSALYKSGKPMEAKLSSLLPSFDVSSVFFIKEGNKYTLDKKYSRLFSSTSLFTPCVNDTIEDLVITIEDDKITILNENSGNGRTVFGAKEEIVYSGFGKQAEIDVTGLASDASSLTWDVAIRNDKDYKELLGEVGGIDILNKIPYFGGVYGEAGVSFDEAYPYLYTFIDGVEDGEALKAKYATELVNNGFKEVKGEEGTDSTYTIEVNANQTLEVYPAYSQTYNVLTGQAGRYFFALIFSLTTKK